ncbi:DUF3592 domain-containing protein [bacterium]|nr:DUF3592 domain-containing protein [bacterium]
MGYYLLGIGSLIVGLGLFGLFNTLKRLIAGERARGVIVGVKQRKRQGIGRKQEIYLFPVIEFETAQGDEFQFTFDSGSWSQDAVGREVIVIYESGKPDEATLHSFMGLWAGPLGALFLGGGAVYGGVQIVFFDAS